MVWTYFWLTRVQGEAWLYVLSTGFVLILVSTFSGFPMFQFERAFHANDLAHMVELQPRLPKVFSTDVIVWNWLLNAMISHGRYRDAIRVRVRFGGRLRDARRLLPQLYGLSLLNTAEALYNRGRWKRAHQLMWALRKAGMLKEQINEAGGHAQIAWIEAHWGHACEALEELSQARENLLPEAYRSELHFTFAVAHLANGDLSRARASLDEARAHLIRPSSRRNILFLEARCAFAEGDFKQAASLCEQAAAHEYKGQGGDGLLLWGDACARLGDSAGAARAWQLAIERDGESESARLAQQRLQSEPPKTDVVSVTGSRSPGPHPPFGHPPPTGEGR